MNIKKELKSFVIPIYKIKDINKKDIFYIDGCSDFYVYVYSYKNLSKFERRSKNG